MKKNFIFLTALASLFISCDELPNNVEPQDEQIPIRIAMSPLTKVSNDLFEEGDMVGLYVSNYNNSSPSTLLTTGNHVDNAKFTNSGSKWNPDEALFWKDSSTPADLYAYYPYAEITDVNAHNFSVALDQSTLEKYESSYFLWGKVGNQLPTESPISIQTNHLMSSLSVYLTYGENFKEDEIALYNVSDIRISVKTTAAIDLATGSITATGNKQNITPYKNGDCYQAIVVPQTVSTGVISVTVNDVSYPLDYDITLLPNTKHTLNVILNKEKLSSDFSFSIGGWEEDSEEHTGNVGIENLASQIIEFEHPEVKNYCIECYDTNGDGELSRLEAALVKNPDIPSSYVSESPCEGKSFNEFVYFTSVTSPLEIFMYLRVSETTLPPSITSIETGLLRPLNGESFTVKFTSLVPPTFSPYAIINGANVYVPSASEEAYRTALAGLEQEGTNINIYTY